MFFLTGASSTINVPSGFTTGFSFYYSAINSPGTIVVYDGLNGTGNVLATLNLPLTPYDGAPDPNGQFSPLVPFGVGFSGTARSVDFAGVVNQIGFDNITFGAAAPGGSTDLPTCAEEGYKGAKLTWCKNICENGLTGQVLDTWIHRWITRYRVLPSCAGEDGGDEGGEGGDRG